MKALNVSIEAIDQILPQTQCGDCQYPGCLPYAEAIQKNQAPIDRCLPGGTNVLKQLGTLLNIDVSSYLIEMAQKAKPKRLAVIREAECIGCTKCIQACPVDAIFGASKLMHTVIAAECTGCGLCVAPCPMDCIDMVPSLDQTYQANHARKRLQNRNKRLAEQEKLVAQQFETHSATEKRQAILAAIARSKQKTN